MSILTIDSDQLAILCKDAEGFAMDASAEEALCKLLDVQSQIDEFVEEVKAKIVENALIEEPDFTTISGDKIKLEYRSFGAEYEITDEEVLDTMFKNYPPIRAKLDTKAVDEYVKLTGELPAGVERRERKKTLVIKRKGEQ